MDKARKIWEQISDAPFPETVEEFESAEINIVSEILVDTNDKYPEIKKIEMVPF